MMEVKQKQRVESSYLLAEVSNATDLEGARGLRVLHLQVHSGSDAFGHTDALKQRCVQVEMLLHGAPNFTKMPNTALSRKLGVMTTKQTVCTDEDCEMGLKALKKLLSGL